MGRATIVEHLGDALYKVQIHRDSQRVRAVIDKWVAEADSIDAQCVELEAEGSELEAAAAEAKADYEQAQVASEDQAEVNRLLGEYLSALAEWEAVANKLFGLQAHARHLRNKASNMEAELAPREDEAWCSTYTTDLEPGQEVATIEVARQGDDYPYHVIAPEGRQPTPDDGQMRSVMSMTPAQTFLNYALWTGAVKWMPRYREGVVYDVDKINQKIQVWRNTPDIPGMQDSYLPEWFAGSTPMCLDMNGYRPGDRVIVDDRSNTVEGWAEHPRESMDSGFFITLRTLHLEKDADCWFPPYGVNSSQMEFIHINNTYTGGPDWEVYDPSEYEWDVRPFDTQGNTYPLMPKQYTDDFYYQQMDYPCIVSYPYKPSDSGYFRATDRAHYFKPGEWVAGLDPYPYAAIGYWPKGFEITRTKGAEVKKTRVETYAFWQASVTGEYSYSSIYLHHIPADHCFFSVIPYDGIFSAEYVTSANMILEIFSCSGLLYRREVSGKDVCSTVLTHVELRSKEGEPASYNAYDYRNTLIIKLRYEIWGRSSRGEDEYHQQECFLRFPTYGNPSSKDVEVDIRH
jgi:chorismate mutase